MAKNVSVAMWTVLVSFVLLSFAGWLVLPYMADIIEEYFVGEQGGAMVQLQTSHVPTASDFTAFEEEQRQVRRDLIDMTGSF